MYMLPPLCVVDSSSKTRNNSFFIINHNTFNYLLTFRTCIMHFTKWRPLIFWLKCFVFNFKCLFIKLCNWLLFDSQQIMLVIKVLGVCLYWKQNYFWVSVGTCHIFPVFNCLYKFHNFPNPVSEFGADVRYSTTPNITE